ncbi:MAG: G5 domain-containing protein [Chloroflexota bacterium]
MRHLAWLRPCLICVYLIYLWLLLTSCQPQSIALAIMDGEQVYSVSTTANTPIEILAGAGVSITPADRILVNGSPAPPDQPLPPNARSLQVRRAVNVTLVTPGGGQAVSTSAPTVGMALHEAGYQLFAADFLDPPAHTPVYAGMSITWRPAQEMMVVSSGGDVRIRSAAGTVGAALAGAGMPLIGLDRSLPAESEALPVDGLVRVVRVHESLEVIQKSIPFETETVSSPDVALGEQKVLQAGQEGLAMTRVRIRYEDGQETARATEAESVVRPPVSRILQTGTKVVISTETVGGVSLDYWYVMQMYATVYSPCNSGVSGCSYGTASGLRAGKGVVAVDPSLYSTLQGQRIYVPGYGYAVIGDLGGGYIVEQNLGVSRYRWIDLGFDDDNLVDMTGWVTVYFLAPAPASIPPALQ